MTEKELFEKLVNKELDAMALKEDIKEIKLEAFEAGHEKSRIALVQAAAKLHVKNTFEETEEKTMELFDLYRVLAGYDAPSPENAAQTKAFLEANPEF